MAINTDNKVSTSVNIGNFKDRSWSNLTPPHTPAAIITPICMPIPANLA